jgi:hypothetical protein
MHRLPRNPNLSRNLGHRSPRQHRPNRIQPLLDHRQRTSANPGLLSPTTSRNIVDQQAALAAKCQAPTDTRVSSTYRDRTVRAATNCRIRLYQIKAALRAGPSASHVLASLRAASRGGIAVGLDLWDRKRCAPATGTRYRWQTVRNLIAIADLPAPIGERALATSVVWADAEGRIHHVSPHEVHFHEVGALDSIAGIAGVSAALHSLEIDSVSASAIAVGS